MPITGTFEADFTQFLDETQKASRGLSGFSILATDTAKSMTGLEKSSASAATQIGTLQTSYMKFDGILNAVGIHIGPQIRALEELGSAATESSGELGLLAEAGLAVGAAMALFKIGSEVQDWFKSAPVAEYTAALLGWGDAATEVAGAKSDAIYVAFLRTGKIAQDAAQALQFVNEKMAEDAKAQAAAVAATHKWMDAMGEVNEALSGHEAILKSINPLVVEHAKDALEAGANQSKVAEAYKLSAAQMREILILIKSEKDATNEAAAARRTHDAEMMTSYNTQITMLRQLEQASQGHYGLEGQINQLKQLAAAEDARTKATYAQLDSEKDRMKLIEGNNKRQQEIALQIATLEQSLADQKGASMARGLAMQKELNQAQGLDAQGAILLPLDAMGQYQKKVDEINATMQDGIEKTQALRQANQALADSFLAEAKAADVATVAQTNKTTAMTAAQAATARANSSFGGGTIDAGNITPQNTDPQIIAYMSEGYTLGEAIAIAMGHGEHILGVSPSYLAKISGGAFRAAGGPVTAGGSYVVGERGPELFSPNVSGMISPSIGGAGGIVVNVNGSVLSTAAELAGAVERAVVAAYRRGGNRLPV